MESHDELEHLAAGLTELKRRFEQAGRRYLPLARESDMQAAEEVWSRSPAIRLCHSESNLRARLCQRGRRDGFGQHSVVLVRNRLIFLNAARQRHFHLWLGCRQRGNAIAARYGPPFQYGPRRAAA